VSKLYSSASAKLLNSTQRPETKSTQRSETILGPRLGRPFARADRRPWAAPLHGPIALAKGRPKDMVADVLERLQQAAVG